MAIELTEHQQRVLDTLGDAPPRVIDPRTSAAYILIPEVDSEAVHEALEEDRRQRAIRAVGHRNAAGRMGEEP
jgi:hypothetical protein